MLGRQLYRIFRLVYRVGRLSKDRFTPAGTLLLGGAIAAGIFGVDTRQSLAFQVFSIGTSLILVGMLCAFSFRAKLSVRRRLPDFATVGVAVNYKLLVGNLGTRAQRDLLLVDELESTIPEFEEFRFGTDPLDRRRNWFDRKLGYPRLMSLITKKRGGTVPPLALHDLPPGHELELSARLFPARRGHLHFHRTRIARPDPLGLYRAINNYANAGSLLVLPKRYRMPAVSMKGTRKYQKGGLSLAGSVGDSREFISLRDYRPGDPLRSIHWRSYAKRGYPVVKEFHDEFYVRQGLLLDTFAEAGAGEKFEEAVSIAASLTVSLNTQDSLLDLMFVGAQAYRFTSGRGLGKTENMLEILACVSPSSGQPFTSLETMLSRYLPDVSGMICVLLHWDDGRRGLLEYIRARHIPVLVFLIGDAGMEMPDISSLEMDSNCFVLLQPGRIQEGLDAARLPGEIS